MTADELRRAIESRIMAESRESLTSPVDVCVRRAELSLVTGMRCVDVGRRVSVRVRVVSWAPADAATVSIRPTASDPLPIIELVMDASPPESPGTAGPRAIYGRRTSLPSTSPRDESRRGFALP